METQTVSPRALNGKRIVVLGGTSGMREAFSTGQVIIVDSGTTLV